MVTGAAGFVGRALIAELLRQGDQVVAVDRFSRRNPAAIDWSGSGREPTTNQSVQSLQTDIRDTKAIARVMPGVDRIFHAAASVATQSWKLSHEINVGATAGLAKSAAEMPAPPAFLYISSLAAAGPGEQPAMEFDLCHPVSHYGRTKLEAENKLHEFASDLPITIVRPPCVIGPGDRNLLALYQTVRRGWNVVLDKTSRYSYISITDLVPAMINASQSGQRLTATNGQDPIDPKRVGTYYLTDPTLVTFVQLAEMIAKTINRDHIRHLQVPNMVGYAVGGYGDVMQRVFGKRMFLNSDKIREGLAGSWICDGTRAKQELSFQPGADLATRIQQTTLSYQQANWIEG